MSTNPWGSCRAGTERKRPGMARCALIPMLLIAAVAMSASAVAAQAPSVEVGSRVRITAPGLDLTEAVGTVQQATVDALVVQFESPRRLATVERSDVTALDVSVGTRRTIGKGIGIGFLVGAGSGALIGLASGDDEGGFISFTAEEKAVMAGLGLGVVGGLVGLVAGAMNRHDVWEPAPAGRPGVAILPLVADDAVGVGIAFSVPVGGPR